MYFGFGGGWGMMVVLLNPLPSLPPHPLPREKRRKKLTSLPQIPVNLTSTITSCGSKICGTGLSSNVTLYGSCNMKDGLFCSWISESLCSFPHDISAVVGCLFILYYCREWGLEGGREGGRDGGVVGLRRNHPSMDRKEWREVYLHFRHLAQRSSSPKTQ